MNNKAKTNRKNIFFTILTDVLFTLLALFMVMVGSRTTQLTKSQAVAAAVPGMQKAIDGYEKKGSEYEFIIDELEDKIGSYEELLGDYQRQVAELNSRIRSGDPLTLMILIDVSKSMTEPIEELRKTMVTLFEIMPNRSKDFRVAVLAFRQGVVSRLPVTRILPTYEDGGRSQQLALKFVSELKAENGFTDHLPVFKEAFSMLAKAHPNPNEKQKTRLVFLGDVGPSELDQQKGYSQHEQQVKEQILRAVQKWAQQGDRGVEALFTESEHSRQDPTVAESRAWFKALGDVSDESAFYTNTHDLLRAIHHATQE